MTDAKPGEPKKRMALPTFATCACLSLAWRRCSECMKALCNLHWKGHECKDTEHD